MNKPNCSTNKEISYEDQVALEVIEYNEFVDGQSESDVQKLLF